MRHEVERGKLGLPNRGLTPAPNLGMIALVLVPTPITHRPPTAPPRHGWRLFSCSECGQVWKEATRDRFSPSKSECSNCGESEQPFGSNADASLKIDASHNLVDAPPNILIRPPAPPL